MHSLFYKAHLNSDKWRKFRLMAIEQTGNKCEECGKSGEKISLEVHHLHYRNLGTETLDDITVCCSDCHKELDQDREDEKHYQAVSTFASRKYGGTWKRVRSFEDAEEEFYEWLENKDR
mgnify:CR=1 FL=1